MTKNQVIAAALIIAFLIIFLRSRSKASPVLPDSENSGPLFDNGVVKFFAVEDYEVKEGDWITKIAQYIIDENDMPRILAMGKAISEFNGLDWAQMDSKPTNNPLDPDTIKVGQILKVPTSWSIESL